MLGQGDRVTPVGSGSGYSQQLKRAAPFPSFRFSPSPSNAESEGGGILGRPRVTYGLPGP
jgi:hypothetical protein